MCLSVVKVRQCAVPVQVIPLRTTSSVVGRPSSRTWNTKTPECSPTISCNTMKSYWSRDNRATNIISQVATRAVGHGAGLEERPFVWLEQVVETISNYFPVLVIAFAITGIVKPSTMTWVPPSMITWAIGFSMLGMGLTLTFQDFKRVLSAPRQIMTGVILQYTVMPSLAFVISRVAQLPIDLTIGLCIVGACPGGTASNIVTYLAKADVPLSVAMTTASTLGAVFMTPLLTSLLVGTLVQVDAVGLLVSTLQVVLFPVVLGCALNQSFPRLVSRVTPFSTFSAVILVAFICGRVMAENSVSVMSAGAKLVLGIFALHAGGFGLGYTVSKYGLGIHEKAARTNAIEVGMQNSALGAMLASQHFGQMHPMAAVPCAISACLHSTLGSLLAWYWGRVASTNVDCIRSDGRENHTLASESQIGVQQWIASWRARTGMVLNDEGAWVSCVSLDERQLYSQEQIEFLARKRSIVEYN